MQKPDHYVAFPQIPARLTVVVLEITENSAEVKGEQASNWYLFPICSLALTNDGQGWVLCKQKENSSLKKKSSLPKLVGSLIWKVSKFLENGNRAPELSLVLGSSGP